MKLKVKKKNKNFFLLKFKSIFFNYKFLSFYNLDVINYNNFELIIERNNLKYFIVKSNDLISLFSKNYFFYFLKNSYLLLYFNNFNDFVNLRSELQNCILLALLFSGYFINHRHLSRLKLYYNFYNCNFNIYIEIILRFIKLLIRLIFIFLILKLIILLFKFCIPHQIIRKEKIL
jgi:hypothetical protein